MNIEVLPMNFNHVSHKKVYQLSPCAICQCCHFIIFIQNNLSTQFSLESISHHLKDKESESKQLYPPSSSSSSLLLCPTTKPQFNCIISLWLWHLIIYFICYKSFTPLLPIPIQHGFSSLRLSEQSLLHLMNQRILARSPLTLTRMSWLTWVTPTK